LFVSAFVHGLEHLLLLEHDLLVPVAVG